MRFVVRSLCCVALAAATAGAQKAADPRDALVVSTAWLAQHLKDPDLVVLFVGDDNEYNKAHIPGSYNVQIEDFAFDDTSRAKLDLQVLPPAQLANRLGALGITDRSRIVVHAGKDFLPWATRLILTLDYAGFGDRTSLLDGGSRAWTKENRPLTAVVPAKRQSALGALHIKPIVVDAKYVKAETGKRGVAVVDGRAPAFYTGASTGGGQEQPASHWPHRGREERSVHDAVHDDDFVRPTAELQSIFANAGVAPGDTVIGYCHIGLQATAMLFAARVLGHPVRLYDGSFEDWSKQPAAEYPVELSKAK